MNSAKTTPSIKPNRLPDLEASSAVKRDSMSQTMMMSEIRKEIASSAVDQIDAIQSLVEQQNKADHAPRGTTAEEAADEQLDSYMKQFMERMTGRKEAEPIPVIRSVQSLPTVSPPPPPRQPARPPENSASLHQMRDVANENSRSAISSHRRREFGSNILLTFVPAAVASVMSSCLAAVSIMNGMHWETWSLVLLTAALGLGCRYWWVSRRLIRDVQ